MNLKGPLDWPHLESLCGGYLHQDFTAEHGSALQAARNLHQKLGVPLAQIELTPMIGINDVVDNIFMPLHTDVVDPTERARAISASSAAARRVRNSFGTDLFELRSGMTPASLHGVAPRLWGMTSLADHFRPPLNLVTSFVRGPRKPMEVSGAVVTRLFSVGPILEESV